jgi:hypothetical protein
MLRPVLPALHCLPMTKLPFHNASMVHRKNRKRA